MINYVVFRTRKRAIILIACLAGICLGVVTPVLFSTGILRMNYPDSQRFPVRGIDISHHQQTIDWQKLRQEQIQFVLIKATEGGDFKDRLFLENWRKAKEAGFIRGAYHFFTFCRPGKEQAQNFIDTVPVEPGTLSPVIDLEFGGNCQTRPSRASLLQELIEYIAAIEQVYGQTPVLYVTYEAYNVYLTGELEQLALWIRDIFWHPRLPDNRAWRFWQYSNRGRLQGIPTYVDLNVFHGSTEEFKRFIR
ncbi:glycoside hydrolase family 25 [Candidatus Vecturithrix granuli]|uniref:Glycoside hydrolase family 25 n=1 Tax=Vecturithrix granuli TaxID=1499967 RepID=A0A081C884_VECG1|nr:glycoside hydrolase family 25 [Candidatus Vecturithrix granuli]